VIVVNAATMRVVQTWDMAALETLAENRMQANFKRGLMTADEVLNGLTWNPQKSVWLMTGKNWDVIFEIQLDTP
jgi:glutamine cyclotransferase